MRHRLLVVGQDITLRGHLARVLKAAGYGVEIAESAAHAKRLERHGVELALAVLDGSGRESGSLVDELSGLVSHVLLVSQMRGPQTGEHIIDVSDETRLLARVAEALPSPYKDENEVDAPILQFAGFSLDPGAHSLTNASGTEIPLTRSEFGLLHAFAQRPGRVLTRDQLLNAFAGRDADAYDRSVDMLVVRLRRKLEKDPKHPYLIVTVPGSGYKFAAKVRRVAATETPDPAAPPSRAPETKPSSPERRYVTALAAELLPAAGARLPADPEELCALIEAFRRYAAAVISQHGGVMREARGRELLAYFGYPVAQEYAAERALYAALALAEHFAEGELALPAGLAIRAGVASGLVIADPAGEVLGETPGEAGRLLALAEPGQAIATADARRLGGSLFAWRDLGLLDMKGLGPGRAWHVLGASPLASRSEALHVDASTPLVDREEERALLLRAWAQAKEGEGRLVLLSGEPGIGKSRLLAALEAELADEPHARLRYFCSPLHQESALYPVIARWEQDCGFARGDSAEGRLAKLEAVLAPGGLPAEDVALIAAMLSVPTGERYPAPELSPQRRKERTFEALHRRLVALTRSGPVLMLFEDAHWADPSTLEMLDGLVDRVAELPILLIVSYRPEFMPPWTGHAGASLIALARLNRRHSTALAAQVTAERVLTPSLLERIVTQTDGVPLFIEELTKAVLEASEELGGAVPTLAVPGTLQASLMARLDRLPAAKQVAQFGAVIGRVFSHALLTAVAQLSEEQLAAGLDEMVASGLAARRGAGPEAVYTFKHALVQDLAYATLLKDHRRAVHRRVGEVLRDLLPNRAEAEPEVVALHFTEAGFTEAAVEWWGKAGKLALNRSAFVEAISHFEKANALARKLDNRPEYCLSRLRLQIAYGHALRSARGFAVPETAAAFARACELAGAVADVRERFPAYNGLWSGSFVSGQLDSMRSVSEVFLREVESQPDPSERAPGYRAYGATCWFLGDFIRARSYFEQALAAHDRERDHELMIRFGINPAVYSMTWLAFVLLPLGFIDQAHEVAEKGIVHAMRSKHIPSITFAHGQLEMFEMVCRAHLRAVPHAEALHGLADEHGMPFWQAVCTFCNGWIEWHKGDRGIGEKGMRKGIEMMQAQRHELFMPVVTTLMAEAEIIADRPKSGLALIDSQIAAIEKTGQRWFLAELHRVRGELLLKRRTYDAAAVEATFMQAIDIARDQSAKLFELKAASSLARLWASKGKRAEARDLLVPIYGCFTEGFDAPDLEDARSLLEDLA